MIRTGEEYRESLRDGREVWIDGERVADVTTHPAFKPIVDARARIYDLAHEPATEDVMSYEEDGERFATGLKPPRTQEDWHAKRRAVDTVMDDATLLHTHDRVVVGPGVDEQTRARELDPGRRCGERR